MIAVPLTAFLAILSAGKLLADECHSLAKLAFNAGCRMHTRGEGLI
jgi:hypothetical protein